jgi:hypothetical protein
MSKDKKNNDENPIEETNSPVVNAVRQSTPTWTDQFQKFIVDLTGVIDDDTYNKN